MNTPISTQVQIEIEELHQFFQNWFNGQLPKTETAYSRFSEALSSDFVIVAPEGSASERPALLEGLWGAHNIHNNMRIWIKDIKLRKVRGDVVWATYEEWQEINGKIDSRLSTVIFSRQGDQGADLKWEHVHETWLPA